jgi:hypothetical protein
MSSATESRCRRAADHIDQHALAGTGGEADGELDIDGGPLLPMIGA